MAHIRHRRPAVGNRAGLKVRMGGQNRAELGLGPSHLNAAQFASIWAVMAHMQHQGRGPCQLKENGGWPEGMRLPSIMLRMPTCPGRYLVLRCPAVQLGLLFLPSSQKHVSYQFHACVQQRTSNRRARRLAPGTG